MNVNPSDVSQWVSNPVTKHYFSQLNAIKNRLTEQVLALDPRGLNQEELALRYSFLKGQLDAITIAIDEEVEINENV